MAELKPLSGGRVRTVFNTHWHLENTGATKRSGKAARRSSRTRTRGSGWPRRRGSRPRIATGSRVRAAAHPTKTFYTDGSMNAGGERIDYGYLIEAHTSGDIYVFFRDSNVLAVGDVASPARDPELDYFTGAWIGGRVDAMDRLLELCDDRTRIVPGFGPVMSRAELQGRARHDEDDLRPHRRSRARGRQRRGHAQSGRAERTGPHVEGSAQFLYDVQKGLWAHHNKLSPNVV